MADLMEAVSEVLGNSMYRFPPDYKHLYFFYTMSAGALYFFYTIPPGLENVTHMSVIKLSAAGAKLSAVVTREAALRLNAIR